MERALTVSGISQMFISFDTRSAAIEGLADTTRPLQDGWRAVVRHPGEPHGRGTGSTYLRAGRHAAGMSVAGFPSRPSAV